MALLRLIYFPMSISTPRPGRSRKLTRAICRRGEFRVRITPVRSRSSPRDWRATPAASAKAREANTGKPDRFVRALLFRSEYLAHHNVPRAFRNGALDTIISPVNGRPNSKIRKIAHDAEKANRERQVKSVTLRGENRL